MRLPNTHPYLVVPRLINLTSRSTKHRYSVTQFRNGLRFSLWDSEYDSSYRFRGDVSSYVSAEIFGLQVQIF